MTNTAGNTWEANIAGTIPVGSNVYYYIEATANNGKTINRPMPAPVGYFDFKILDNTSDIQDDIDMELSVFPNPASAITCIPVSVSHNTQATIFLVDVLGQNTNLIFEGELPMGESKHFIDASQYPAGAYNIVLQTTFGQSIQTLIIH